MDKHQLCGLNDQSIDRDTLAGGLHCDVLAPFLALQELAAVQGFELAVASAYRDFDRQLMIWNAKASGERAVLDKAGQPLDITTLEPWALVQAILRWSALPGASRHHWGTDIDVYDRRAVAEDYPLQLVDEEVYGNGPFVPLHDWLDRCIDGGHAEGFFRPYQVDRGGIAPERWHLSYAPLALEFQQALDVDTLYQLIAARPVKLKQTVMDHLDEIYQRFVYVPETLYPLR